MQINAWYETPCYIYTELFVHDLWAMDIAVEDDILGNCGQKSLYKHVSDIEWLQIYNRLKQNVKGKKCWKYMK